MASRRAPRKDGREGRERQALVVLLELTQELTDNRPLEDSLYAVTEAALKLVPGDHASIRLLDGSQSELLSGARSGSGRDLPPMSFRRGEGLIGWVVEHREGIRVDEARKDSRFVPDARKGTQGFLVRSLLAEPLWSAGNVIGVLSISSPEPSAFSADHQLLVRLLANCSAPPIERARLRRLAMTDDLTLAYNQRYLTPRFYEEIERARRNGSPVSVLLMDLDHFKKVNDDYGHNVGDAVLRIFADRVRSMVRRVDVFIRRGGEEFTLVMPATTLDHARATAERIRSNLSESPLDVGDGIIVRQTVSIGAATWNGEETPEALQQRADMAMYRAKELGRNQVVIAADEEVAMPKSLRPLP
jgi:diguanylate cyclase (GGDEF)-like protein